MGGGWEGAVCNISYPILKHFHPLVEQAEE
jgi:hypothetical protein